MKNKVCTLMLLCVLFVGAVTTYAASYSTLGGTFIYGRNTTATYSQFYHGTSVHGSDITVGDFGLFDSDYNVPAGYYSWAVVGETASNELSIAACYRGRGNSGYRDQVAFY